MHLTGSCFVLFCLSDPLSEKDLADVQTKVYDARTKWYNLGLKLGQLPSALDSIDDKHSSDPSQCFCEVLKVWLNEVDPPPTWQAMMNALNSSTVGHHQLAEEIQAELPLPGL